MLIISEIHANIIIVLVLCTFRSYVNIVITYICGREAQFYSLAMNGCFLC
jgi:hypothetical protein